MNEELIKYLDKKFSEAKQERDELKTDVVSLKVGLQEVKTDLTEIKENIIGVDLF